MAETISDLVPAELVDEYQNNEAVRSAFSLAALNGRTREDALIAIVKRVGPLVRHLLGEIASHAREAEMVEPLSGDEIKDLLRAALFWRAQGSAGVTTHWTTPRSQGLALVIDRLREKHPMLCAVLDTAEVPE